LKYLNLLSEKYPNIQSAITEIINLNAILGLPKGTEHFVSDIHGEDAAFLHILNNASGVIKEKIDYIFEGKLTDGERKSLATLIYYPAEKLELLKAEQTDMDAFYRTTLDRLLEILRVVSSKYSQSKTRKALPKDYAYAIDELLKYQDYLGNRDRYYGNIISTIINLGSADSFIYAMCELIKRFAVDHLHVLGDIFDRGPGPDKVMDALIKHHSVDITWGNHDILWMGAAAGHDACIANVLRISLRYNHMACLEESYGINLLPLAKFAMDTYGHTDVSRFIPKNSDSDLTNIAAMMQKAMTIIQLKLEAQVIRRHPEYKMDDRMQLHLIDFDKKTICIDGTEYELLDCDFPTVDPADPYKLTAEEEHIVERLRHSFENSILLQRHIRFMFTKGSMYLKYNGNLLYHGCVPVNRDAEFEGVEIEGSVYKGRALFEKMEEVVRRGFYAKDGSEEKEFGMDMMWYLWNGPKSPLFGKAKMATFERYVVADKKLHKEDNNAYFKMRDTDRLCDVIFDDFGLDKDTARIINGHVPVKVKESESPIKAGGRLMDIDGGMSIAYQSVTGIAGYTLIYNSYSMRLVSHEAFKSKQEAVENEMDIHSTEVIEMKVKRRQRVADTDVGIKLQSQIDDLTELLHAYRNGTIKERFDS